MVGSPAIYKVTGTRNGATSPVVEAKLTTLRTRGKYHRRKSIDVVVKKLRRCGRISGANGNDTFRSSYRDTTFVRLPFGPLDSSRRHEKLAASQINSTRGT
jgi:hypothetical protein